MFVARFANGYNLYTNSARTSGVTMTAGAGSWSTISDKNKKENYEEVDGEEILKKLSTTPIMKWNYISQKEHIKHIGPFAQDFYAAFDLGDDGKSISTIDPDGIALKAIQTLYATQLELKTKTEKIAELESRLEKLEELLLHQNNQ